MMLSAYNLDDYEVKKLNGQYVDSWHERYWYVILIGIISVVVVTLIIYTIYKSRTRIHNITLYCGNETTVVQCQHGKVFSAPMLSNTTSKQFKGWFRDTAFMIPYNSSDKVISDFTLYAKFE